jgi:signal transduction histidine kinase
MTELDAANAQLHELSDGLQQKVQEATAELEANLEELRESKQRLEEEQHAREQFIAMVVHEISQPLSAISTYAQLLQRPNLSADGSDRAKAGIVSESRRLARLSQDLAYASQLARNAFQITAADFDLAALVRQQADLARDAAHPEIELDVPDETIPISGDRDRLAQVISNLISNALRHAPGGAVKVRLAQERGKALLSVADTGPGIDPKQLDLIFEPYVRLSGSHGAGPAGSGLGLYIAKAIVDAHHGRIWVESQLGQGTTFYVELALPRGKAAKA